MHDVAYHAQINYIQPLLDGRGLVDLVSELEELKINQPMLLSH